VYKRQPLADLISAVEKNGQLNVPKTGRLQFAEIRSQIPAKIGSTAISFATSGKTFMGAIRIACVSMSIQRARRKGKINISVRPFMGLFHFRWWTECVDPRALLPLKDKAQLESSLDALRKAGLK